MSVASVNRTAFAHYPQCCDHITDIILGQYHGQGKAGAFVRDIWSRKERAKTTVKKASVQEVCCIICCGVLPVSFLPGIPSKATRDVSVSLFATRKHFLNVPNFDVTDNKASRFWSQWKHGISSSFQPHASRRATSEETSPIGDDSAER